MKRIVYILSTNYAGSHLLSLLIGSHSKCQHIGEVKGLAKTKQSLNRQFCGLCGGHEKCPVLGGIKPGNVGQIYETIFSNIDSKIGSLVDTSKKIDWARRFLHDNRYEKKYIFLVRDPRSLVRRWLCDEKLKHFRERLKLIKYSPRYINMGLFGDMDDIFIGKWLQQNGRILDFVHSNALDCYVLTYHDLVVRQSGVLTEIMDWLGEKYEQGQEEYWNFTHHGSAKNQYKNKKSIELDCRWKAYLSLEQQMKILRHRDITLFLKKCGLLMGDDGLLKIPST